MKEDSDIFYTIYPGGGGGGVLGLFFDGYVSLASHGPYPISSLFCVQL